jgi:hypothetical protein
MSPSYRFLQVAAITLLLCAAAATARAQEDPRRIIQASLNALGSPSQRAKVRNIRALARCVGPNGPYTTAVLSLGNSRLIFEQVRKGNSYHGRIYDEYYWTKDQRTLDVALADQRAAFAWRSHDFQGISLQPAQRFREPKFAGYESFADKNAVKLTAIDELNHPAELYFDRETKLLLGFVIQNPFAEQVELIRTVFNEWKLASGVKLPSKVTVTDKQGDFVLSFYQLEINTIAEYAFTVPPTVVAMRELLEMHRQARAAHFGRDADKLVADLADDYTNVTNGQIQQPGREASLTRFKNYFGRSAFLEWDDITPPVIKVSADATMAYMIVNLKLRLTAAGEDGKPREQSEVFAWLATYRKIEGVWKMTAIASTNTPEPDK